MAAMTLREVKYLQKRTALLTHMENEISGFKIIRKDRSFLMKALSFFLFFNKKFMTEYVTTIYPKVYVPKDWGISKSVYQKGLELEILAHEYIHLHDRKQMGVLFNIMYLSPQIFSLLAILAIWNSWFLLCLLFLLPWPSPGRTWLEYRGYKMSLIAKYWILTSIEPKKEEVCWGWITNDGINWALNQFTGPSYYYMFPFREYLRKSFIKSLKDVRIDGKLSPEFEAIKDILGK